MYAGEVKLGPISASVCGYRLFEWVGRCHGDSTACVSPQKGRPQCGPAGAGVLGSDVLGYIVRLHVNLP